MGDDAPPHAVLRPSASVRWATGLVFGLGAATSALYVLMGMFGHGTRFLVPAAVVVLVLAVRPLVALRGRTVLTRHRVTALRPPAAPIVVPAPQVTSVQIRRGLFLEWPVLHRWDGTQVDLSAPTRLWFLPDAAYWNDLDALRAGAGHPVPRAGHLWSPSRLLMGLLLPALAILLVFADPPWKSDVWPLRPHAQRLPDTCRVFDAKARRLLPGARVDRAFSRNDDSSTFAQRHICQWNATRVEAGSGRVVEVGRLSIDFELDHGMGRLSDSDEAHRTFDMETRLDAGETGAPLRGTGDEGRLIVEHTGQTFAWVTVVVRKANVDEKIDLIIADGDNETQAAATATRLARMGLSVIRFSRAI